MIGGGSIDGCCGDPCPDWTADFGTDYPRYYKARITWSEEFCPTIPAETTCGIDFLRHELLATHYTGSSYCGNISLRSYCSSSRPLDGYMESASPESPIGVRFSYLGVSFKKEDGSWFATIRVGALNSVAYGIYRCGPVDLSDLSSITLSDLTILGLPGTENFPSSITLTEIDGTLCGRDTEGDCPCEEQGVIGPIDWVTLSKGAWSWDTAFDYDRCTETKPEYDCCLVGTVDYTCWSSSVFYGYQSYSGSFDFRVTHQYYGSAWESVFVPDSGLAVIAGMIRLITRCGKTYLVTGLNSAGCYPPVPNYLVEWVSNGGEAWPYPCPAGLAIQELGDHPMTGGISFPFTASGSWAVDFGEVPDTEANAAGADVTVTYTGFGECVTDDDMTWELPCGAHVTGCIALRIFGVCGDQAYPGLIHLSGAYGGTTWTSGTVTTADGTIEVTAYVDEDCVLHIESTTYFGEHYLFEVQLESGAYYRNVRKTIDNAVEMQVGDTRYVTKVEINWLDRAECNRLNDPMQSEADCYFCEGNSFVVDTLVIRVPGSTVVKLQRNFLEKTAACIWQNDNIADCTEDSNSFSIEVTGNKDGCSAYFEATVTKLSVTPNQWVKYRKTVDVRTEEINCFGTHTLTEYSRSGAGEIPECGSTFVIEAGSKSNYHKPAHLSDVHSAPYYVHVRLVDPPNDETIYDIPLSGSSDDDHWIFHYGPGYVTPDSWSSPPSPCLSGAALWGDMEIKYTWLDYYCLLMEFTLTLVDAESNECSLYCGIRLLSPWEICSGDEFQCGDFYISIDPEVNWIPGNPCVKQPYAT